jgi:hypothetical protein
MPHKLNISPSGSVVQYFSSRRPVRWRIDGREVGGRLNLVVDARDSDVEDDRPPICPACGVTMGIVVVDDGTTQHVCLECGFPDDQGMAERP